MAKLDETLACRRMGDVMLCVHSAEDPTEAAWNRYADQLEEATRDPDQPLRFILVFSAGGAPNAGQRGRITSIETDVVPRTAILTDSKVARGAAVVIGWFGTPIQAFPTSQVDQAIEWLGIPEIERSDVLTAFGEERAALIG